MLRNTRSFEKNSFIRFLRLSQVRSLFASEYEQAQTAYERYINCIQRLFRPGKLSPSDTLHMMAKLRIKLIAIQEEPVKVAPEMESLLRAAIALTNFEIKMVWLKVSHPAVMDCSKKVALPKSPIYLAEQFTPTDLMEIVTSMQGLGVGRCLDGSQASLDMFVESFSWMFNVRINNPNQCKHAILNRKLRLTRFLDLLRGYLIERSQQ